jgi:hypothetical protein
MSRDFTINIFKYTGNENQPPQVNSPLGSNDVQHSTFGAEYKRYGRGHTLASKTSAFISSIVTQLYVNLCLRIFHRASIGLRLGDCVGRV